jgi:acyl-ACP thioesterase
MIIYEQHYRIPVYDTDYKGLVYIHSLLNYIQDIAAGHAELLKFGREDLLAGNRFWILSRQLAEFYRLPAWGETITLKTWPRGTEGLFALRDIEITDGKGEIVAAASTSWVIVDLETRRPCRPDAEPGLANREFPQESALQRNAGKIKAPAEVEVVSLPFWVKPGDLDVNYHVNNVKYIQWVMDSMPMAFLSSNRVSSLEVNYIAEGVDGDQITILKEIAPAENNRHLYSVIRSGDSRELCRIMIAWEPVAN